MRFFKDKIESYEIEYEENLFTDKFPMRVKVEVIEDEGEELKDTEKLSKPLWKILEEYHNKQEK